MGFVDEVFLRLVREEQTTWPDRRKFHIYAAKKAHDLYVEELRKSQAKKRAHPRADDHDPNCVAAQPRDDASFQIDLHQAISNLEPDCAEVVCLRFVWGYTFEEIAGIFESPVSTVQTQWHRALATLRRKLKGLDDAT
jgi:RNA polymerase sigma factor (sigma-70 family)